MSKSTKSKKAIKLAESPKTNIHLELTSELYRTFDFFNEHFCQNKLPRPVITVATKGRATAHGWFCHSIWKQKDDTLHEIQMCGESLSRGHVHTIGTLVHEMAHLKNFVDNDGKVVDCTPQQRHNKIFQKAAEFFGLVVTSSKRFGSAHTTPGEICMAAIEKLQPNEELYNLYRESFNAEAKEKKNYGKLKPVMVDEETKELITKAAEELGMTQKEFTQAAAKLFVQFSKKSDELGELIFSKRKQYKNVGEVTVDIVDTIGEAPGVEEPAEEQEA